MTNNKVFTYDPNPNGGEDTGRNWFNMDTISCESSRFEGGNGEVKSKPGGTWTAFSKIPANQFVDGVKPYFKHGKTYDTNGKYMGTRWTIEKNLPNKAAWPYWQDYALTAQEAAIAITSGVYDKAAGWTKENKGFMIDYYGWHGANSSWHQKYCWEVYNKSSNRLALPVKGISFTLRVPNEDDMFAVDDSINDNDSKKARGDQTSINKIYGLWFYPKIGKYLTFEMTINGNRHAPSPHPDLEGTPWHQHYWFADAEQSSKGNNTHISNLGWTYRIQAWANEPILAECNFCGFVVDNVVDHAATSRAPHTYQFGNLAPIPFHMDRTGDFKAVYGGFKSDGDLRSIYTETT